MTWGKWRGGPLSTRRLIFLGTHVFFSLPLPLTSKSQARALKTRGLHALSSFFTLQFICRSFCLMEEWNYCGKANLWRISVPYYSYYSTTLSLAGLGSFYWARHSFWQNSTHNDRLVIQHLKIKDFKFTTNSNTLTSFNISPTHNLSTQKSPTWIQYFFR